ncbi:MAG: diacylglycerol kinase family protein [Bacteroidota bacterium]
MQKSIAFILNPVSGKGSKDNFLKKVTQIEGWEGWSYEILYTERVGHATELAREYSNKVDYIIAVGGDGTVHEVAKGVAGSGAVFGIIPMGSGNGVARHLKISMQIDKAIKEIRYSGIHKIDTIRINGEFLLGVGGAGFDAHIAHEFDKAPSRGLATYAKLSLKEYFNYEAIEYDFTINDINRKGKAFLFAIANSCQWGNDFFISPESSMKGGKAKLIIVEETDKASASLLAPALLTKSILKLPFVKSYDFNTLDFELDSFTFHIDGEPRTISGKQTVKVIEDDLLVCLPGQKV